MPRKVHPHRADAIREYTEGVAVAEILDKRGLKPGTLYRWLNQEGVPRRGPKTGKLPPLERVCCVCGKVVKGSRSSNWRYLATCGEVECVAFLAFRPDLAPPEAAKRSKSGSHPKARKGMADLLHECFEALTGPELDEATLALDTDEQIIPDFEPTGDERGADMPEAQKALWGRLSRLTVALQRVDREGGEVGLWLPVRPGRSAQRAFVDELLGGDRSSLALFDYLYIWRCSCPMARSYEIETIDDLPGRDGWYGACPQCGGVALRIERTVLDEVWVAGPD